MFLILPHQQLQNKGSLFKRCCWAVASTFAMPFKNCPEFTNYERHAIWKSCFHISGARHTQAFRFLDKQKDTGSFVFSVPVQVKEGMYIRNGACGGQCKGRIGALEHVSHAAWTPNGGRMPQCDNSSHNTLNKQWTYEAPSKIKHLTLVREGKISML